jgi:aryl-alcohol dehydrogenase-like predicted oxidoreductase
MTAPMTLTLRDCGTVPRLGLGTWAIGGRWTNGGQAAGWGDTSDDVSRAAIRAGVAGGVRVFDTAQAYGCGHSERLLGEVLSAHPEVCIVTKVGYVMDEDRRDLQGAATVDQIEASVDASRRRLQRDRIDLVLLHHNSMPVAEAAPVFDRLETLRARGWLKTYGWSTDYPDRAAAFAAMPGFAAVEHAMNVYFPATKISETLAGLGLPGLIRSPLAMGLLGGRYAPGHRFGPEDIRSRTMDWMDYFKDGVVDAGHWAKLSQVRDLLTTGRRSPAQGALGWLWAHNPRALPLPGFRTVEQVEDLCGALAKGPLDEVTMSAVETAIARSPEGPPRDR